MFLQQPINRADGRAGRTTDGHEVSIGQTQMTLIPFDEHRRRSGTAGQVRLWRCICGRIVQEGDGARQAGCRVYAQNCQPG